MPKRTNLNRRLLAASVLLTFAAVPLATAFLDEVASLKAELAAWQEVHTTTDFSDVIEQLDDISGTVFNDTDDSAWYAPYVASLTDWGVVSGYRDEQGRATGEFGPGDPVTIAEALKMATEASENDVSSCGGQPALQTAKTHWSNSYVACAESLKARLFDGDSIDLDRPALRSEVLVIVHDLFDDQVPELFASYNDTIDHPYEADIAYASLLEIVAGDTNEQGQAIGAFRPDQPINRAEASKIIYLKIKDLARQEVL